MQNEIPVHTILENEPIKKTDKKTYIKNLPFNIAFAPSYKKTRRIIQFLFCEFLLFQFYSYTLSNSDQPVPNAQEIQAIFTTYAIITAVIFATDPHNDNDNNAYLCTATENNNLAELYHLLYEKHLDPDTQNMDILAPLHIAAKNGYIEAAKLLIKKNADIGILDCNDYTPLHTAAQYNHREMISLLCLVGAIPYQKDGRGETPLHKTRNPDCMQMLLDYGANPDTRNVYGEIAYGIQNIPMYSFYKDIIEHFFDFHSTHQQKLLTDFRIYTHAVSHDNFFTYITTRHQLPDIWLMYAIWFRDIHVLDILLDNVKQSFPENPFPLNRFRDIYSNGVLHTAAQYDDTKILTKLMQAGADPETINNDNETPYDIAKKHGHKKIGRILRDWYMVDRLAQQPRIHNDFAGGYVPQEIRYRINQDATPANLQYTDNLSLKDRLIKRFL
jgi:ankyrin repeat protein